MFFGNDENAQKIWSQNTGVFWGHHQTAYEFSGKMEKIGNICQEIFHLGQVGCMNPRILIVPSEVSFEILTKKLQSAFHKFWGKALHRTWVHSAQRYQETMKPFCTNTSSPSSLPWISEVPRKYTNLLTHHGGDYFGVFLLRYKNKAELELIKKDLLPTLTYKTDQENTQFQIWNGRHLGKPLFCPE